MSPEKQRVAIAEACGWKRGESECWWKNGFWAMFNDDLPDYLNDLNAMHEAEKVLNGVRRAVFEFALLHEVLKRPEPFNYDRGDIMAVITATAAQRAEAFLRTVGKWEKSA